MAMRGHVACRTRVVLALLVFVFFAATLVPGRTAAATFSPLRWLARHQNPDRTWGHPTSPPDARTRLTGMALLGFSGAGYTHLSRDVYDGICFGQVVKRGLKHLTDSQDASGCLVTDAEALDAHLWGSLALTEAYGLTGSSLWKAPAEKATVYLETRQRVDGGWGKGGRADPVLTARAIAVLASARMSELPLSEALTRGADRALRDLAERDRKEALDPLATSALAWATIVWRKSRADPALGAWAGRIAGTLKTADRRNPDLDYWCTLALYEYDGPAGYTWQAWGKEIRDRLVGTLRSEADSEQRGSWDPPGGEEAASPEEAATASAEEQDRIQRLIGVLRSMSWAEREGATDALFRLGQVTIPFLREAQAHADAEVRARAAHVVRALLWPEAYNRRIEITCLNAMALEVYYRYGSGCYSAQ